MSKGREIHSGNSLVSGPSKTTCGSKGMASNPTSTLNYPEEINTDNSLLWIVDATSSRGHIIWVYNNEKKEVEHISSFFPSRSGVGKGNVNENGDVQLIVMFEGEPANTYRKYSYTWINENEYALSHCSIIATMNLRGISTAVLS